MYRSYRMAVSSSHSQRILAFLQKSQNNVTSLTAADFTQSILNYFQDTSDHVTRVCVELTNNKLILSQPANGTESSMVKIKRPSFCPIHHLSREERDKLPDEIRSRGVDTGVAVILETSDNKVLLTRRADHLRTFPSIWVPPGGHIEANETLIEAGLRELEEETGLHLIPKNFEGGNLEVLALWESVYPPKLAYGLPKRHHIVTYIHGRLTSDLTPDLLMSRLHLDPGEVGACAWFGRDAVEAIVAVTEEMKGSREKYEHFENEQFSAIVINKDKEPEESYLPFSPLLRPAQEGQDQLGRVSTGTKFALEEWLAKTST